MSLLLFLTEISPFVLETLVICLFVILFLLILCVVFVPTTTEKIVRIISAFCPQNKRIDRDHPKRYNKKSKKESK